MLAVIFFLATTVLTSPVQVKKTAIVPLRHHAHVTSIKHVIKKDRLRLKRFNSNRHVHTSELEDRTSSGSIRNDMYSYTAGVDIGGKTWHLIVDSGSSITWYGSQTACEQSPTGNSTGNSVNLAYGSGTMQGTEYIDTVSLAGLTVASQSIGSASQSIGFASPYVDGFLGLGPVGLTKNTITNRPLVPTFMDNLYSQGSITTEVLGIYFKPEIGSNMHDVNGELTLGGYDTSKFISQSLHFVPKLSSSIYSASSYWGVAISNILWNGRVLDTNIQGIVDTGTTLIYISENAFNNWMKVTGGYEDLNTGLTAFSTQPTGVFNINIGSASLTLTPGQYLVPQAQYANWGLNTSLHYSWVASSRTEGTGDDATLGQKFIESYYTILDTTNSRIGFALRT